MWKLTFWLLFFLFNNIYQAEAKCPLPNADVNTKVSTNDLDPGSIATYTCDKDYELFGSATRTCGADGAWSGSVPMCATNVAFRKPVNQSSTVRGGPPENANDGDRTTLHDGDKCTQTNVEDSPWWSVDLLQEYEIAYIRITTRSCCDQQDVQDLEVRVGDSATNQQRNKLCAWYPGAIEKGTTKELKCARPIKGRYVFVQMVGVKGSLSLCEIEVFSKEELSKDRCKGNFDVNKLGLFNRTCYEFQVTSGGTFDIARKYCQKRREGDLVNKIEPMTQKFLVSELERHQSEMPTKMLWIGVQKEPQFISRVWRWVDGTKVDTPAWGREQPNNFNGKQNCVVLDGSRDWLWNDVGCNLNYLFWMCQFHPSCGSPDRKLNTTFTIKPTPNDTIAIYSCPTGNKVIGEAERTCSPTGYWSGEAPTCKFIDCRKPKSIENGVVSLVDGRTTYDARATYVCAENYTMDGNNTVVCGDDGDWEPRVPECLYSWCPELETPANGVLTLSGRRSGDTATFSCNPGFYLAGEKTLSCALGGTWSGEPPTCQFVDCGLPESMKNGKMSLVNGTTFVGSLAVYQCDEDYWLQGPSSRICETSGYWGGEMPICERINCGEPEIPVGGYVTGYSLEVHSEVDYHCEGGHYMTGEPKRTCTREGKWSGEAPACTFVDCGSPLPIMKGELIYESEDPQTFLDSVIRYKCMPNYRLIGEERRVCMKSGKWSGESPRCEEIRCGEPEYPLKSRVSVTGNDRRLSLAITRVRHNLPTNSTYKVGSHVNYRCERGYVVDGVNVRTCLANGTWSAQPPNCKFIDCGKPPNVERGIYRLLSNETSYGSVVAYECEANWKIDGKVRRHCLENGTWSGGYPKCIEILCPSLSNELEKRYKEEDEREIDSWNKELIAKREKDREVRIFADDGTRRVGSSAYYKCQEGQRVVGEQTRLCKQHGVWGGSEPKCEWVYCEKPENIANGRVHLLNDDLRFGSVVEYFCLPKYFLHGPFNRTCTSNGTWSGEEPRCTLDDTNLGSFEYNTIDGTSNLARGPMDESFEGASYTGIYVGIAVSLVFVIAVALALIFFKTRENRMSKTNVSSSSSSSTTKPIEHSPPEVMTYLDLHDPSTGNNIYEHIPDDIDSSSYTNMSPTNSFTPSPHNSYSNFPTHTYSNTGRESHYENGSIASANINNNGKIPHHISRRPRMPPPQPPQVPASVTAGVTVNGVRVNTGS